MNFSLGDEVKDHAKAQDTATNLQVLVPGNILILNRYYNITVSYC